MLVAGLLVVAVVAVIAGGVGYREECLSKGEVHGSWSWAAAIPYVSPPRPARGCVVHSGSRVALAGLGIAHYRPPRAPPVAPAAYRAEMDAAVRRYIERLDGARSLQDALAHIRTLIADVEVISPPKRYTAAHSRFVAAARDVEAGNAGMLRAATGRDQPGFDASAADARSAAARLSEAGLDLERLRAAG